jgi:hypothetical protein
MDTIINDVVQSDSISVNYPINYKTKDSKRTRSNVKEFFIKLVETCPEDLLRSENSPLKVCIDWLVAMGNAPNSSIRHTASFCCMSLGIGLLKVGET